MKNSELTLDFVQMNQFYYLFHIFLIYHIFVLDISYSMIVNYV